MEYNITIHWDGSLSTLNSTISKGLSKVSHGKYKHGKVVKANTERCKEHAKCYCMKLLLRLHHMDSDRCTYTISWSEEDQAYIGRVLEFPYLGAHGDTPTDTLKEIIKVVSIVLEGDKDGQ